MAAIGASTKVGIGYITGRTAPLGTGATVRYDFVGTWVHGATGQISKTNVRPKRVFDKDDEVIEKACKVNDPCMFSLKPGDDEPELRIFDEVYGVDDCP